MTPSAESQRVFAPGILDGQVAIITGGGSGIGLVTAQEMTRLGAKVAICGRTPEKLAAAAASMPGVLAEPCDIREPAQVEAFVAPNAVYDDAMELSLGSRDVRLQAFPGHTGGDSIVLIPDAKVAFMGDLFWRQTLPNTVDASTGPWVATLDRVTTTLADYTFVPGHGDIGTVGDVTAFHDYLAALREAVANAQSTAPSEDALVDAVMPTLAARYGQWEYFKYFIRPNILQMNAELRGTKRIPVSRSK